MSAAWDSVSCPYPNRGKGATDYVSCPGVPATRDAAARGHLGETIREMRNGACCVVAR